VKNPVTENIRVPAASPAVPTSGFNGPVTISVYGHPAGASASFTPATINTGTGTSTLNVVIPSGVVAPGSYTLLLTFTGSGVINDISITRTVNP
jgi:hypothetical protein